MKPQKVVYFKTLSLVFINGPSWQELQSTLMKKRIYTISQLILTMNSVHNVHTNH